MANPLPLEIRASIIYHKQNGSKNAEISKWLRVSRATVKRIWRLYKEENTVIPKPANRGRRPAFCDKKLSVIADRIREQPDITLAELIDEYNLPISVSALSRKLINLDLTFKKRRCLRRSNSALMFNGFAASGSDI